MSADEYIMALALFLFIGIPALVTTGVLIGPSIGRQLASRRVIVAAERSVGIRSRRRPLRLALATGVGWAIVTLPLLSVSPTAGVWAGGAVVMAGCALILRHYAADGFTMDDRAFDVAVRELLDQA